TSTVVITVHIVEIDDVIKLNICISSSTPLYLVLFYYNKLHNNFLVNLIEVNITTLNFILQLFIY
ncbi:hypothetical protein, partial [Clostridium perfringens]|uniref:hypothetical protein n=1 Tax=Clostridium perfringens TaxID=1502 RepID=UPI0039EBCAE7